MYKKKIETKILYFYLYVNVIIIRNSRHYNKIHKFYIFISSTFFVKYKRVIVTRLFNN